MIHLIVIPARPLEWVGLNWTTVPDDTGPVGLAAIVKPGSRWGGGDVCIDMLVPPDQDTRRRTGTVRSAQRTEMSRVDRRAHTSSSSANTRASASGVSRAAARAW